MKANSRVRVSDVGFEASSSSLMRNHREMLESKDPNSMISLACDLLNQAFASSSFYRRRQFLLDFAAVMYFYLRIPPQKVRDESPLATLLMDNVQCFIDIERYGMKRADFKAWTRRQRLAGFKEVSVLEIASLWTLVLAAVTSYYEAVEWSPDLSASDGVAQSITVSR